MHSGKQVPFHLGEFQHPLKSSGKRGGGRLLSASLQFPENINFIKHRF